MKSVNAVDKEDSKRILHMYISKQTYLLFSFLKYMYSQTDGEKYVYWWSRWFMLLRGIRRAHVPRDGDRRTI